MYGQLVSIQLDYDQQADDKGMGLLMTVVEPYVEVGEALQIIIAREKAGCIGLDKDDETQTCKLIDKMKWPEEKNEDGHLVLDSVRYGGILTAEDDCGEEYRFIPISLDFKGIDIGDRVKVDMGVASEPSQTFEGGKSALEEIQHEDRIKAEQTIETLIGMIAQEKISRRSEGAWFDGKPIEIEHHISPDAVLHIRNFRDPHAGKPMKIDGRIRIQLVVTTKDAEEALQWMHSTGASLWEMVPDICDEEGSSFGAMQELLLFLDTSRTMHKRQFDAANGQYDAGEHVIVFKLK